MADTKNYVGFRAGPELLAQLEARRDGSSLGVRAERHLRRYYNLLADELRTLRLSEAEGSLVCDALNGIKQLDGSERFLWAEVAEAIRMEQMDRKWGVDGADLVERLRSLSPGQRLALADAVEQFWAWSDGWGLADGLRAVGLLHDPALGIAGSW